MYARVWLLYLNSMFVGFIHVAAFIPVTVQYPTVVSIHSLSIPLLNNIWVPVRDYQGFPCGSEVKASAYIAGDLGSIPGVGRSLGEGNGNSLQYSCLENPMDGGACWATVHGVTKIQTRLSDFTFTFYGLLQIMWTCVCISDRYILGLKILGYRICKLPALAVTTSFPKQQLYQYTLPTTVCESSVHTEQVRSSEVA